MRKILLLDDHFPTGESTLQPVLLWGPGNSRIDTGRVTKTASEALDYIKNVQPEPGKTQMLVLALGSEEAYGPNRNGDGFPERPIPAKTKHASSDNRKWWVAPGEELTKHYQSFETNPAHAFLHHQNQDPAKASGHVKKAFWNPKMHRVELLIIVDNQKDSEWVNRVNDGDFPAVSMGCRIKHDICSRCGNIAPTRAQYCEHVRNGMNQINPDGTKNYVHNPSPNFFDISRVFRPADRTGYTLKKVAHVYELQSSASLGEDADALANKAAAIRKLSDIEKIVRGQPVASSSTLSNGERVLIDKFREYAAPRMASMSEIPPSTFQGHPLAEALSSLASIKTPLTGPEFVRLIVSHLSGEPLPEHVVQKTAALLPTVLALFERSPALFDDVLKTGALNSAPQHVNQSLLGKLAPFAKRANLSSLLYRGLVPEGTGLRPDEAPSTDLLNYQDPRSGQTVQTTRGAATDASEAQTRAGLKKTIGGAGLLYGAYKAMGAFPSLRPLRAPAAALGAYAMMRRSPEQTFHTAEGLEVPESTEFAPQEKFSEDSLSRIVLAALTDVRATGVSTVNQALVDQLEKRGHVDTTRGVVLNLDEVAEALGNIVLA